MVDVNQLVFGDGMGLSVGIGDGECDIEQTWRFVYHDGIAFGRGGRSAAFKMPFPTDNAQAFAAIVEPDRQPYRDQIPLDVKIGKQRSAGDG